jgi:HAD superfamily hydrolase (TIGR01484 family)
VVSHDYKPGASGRAFFRIVKPPIKLISTDFDGTVHTDFETPPVPLELETLIGDLQQRGVKWVINTGRDLTSLMETLTQVGLSVRPDYVVVVEREIYELKESDYVSVTDWNDKCARMHSELFQKVRPHMPRVTQWINHRYNARVYEDPYSPFCLIAEKTRDAEEIHDYLEIFCRDLGDLVVVRNDVYARFSHKAFNKGTALAEIARRLEIMPEEIVACGDHWNDLPMLSREFAHWLVAPMNAIAQVKEAVLRQNGIVSEKHCGYGVAHGIATVLKRAGYRLEKLAESLDKS